MPANIFGSAMDDQVRAQRQGVGVDRRGDGVVYNNHCSNLVSRPRQPLNVDHFQGRVGRRFQIQHRAAFFDLGFDGFVVVGRAEFCLDIQARQKAGEDLISSAVGIFDRDHAVAGFEQRVERVADGCHPRGKTGRCFGSF